MLYGMLLKAARKWAGLGLKDLGMLVANGHAPRPCMLYGLLWRLIQVQQYATRTLSHFLRESLELLFGLDTDVVGLNTQELNEMHP